jgi:16S rRNA (guanine(966)-N(2))-methyltransferase RsmD
MRVISGTARGRQLRSASDTRPTADLIKGAIFSMLEAQAYKRGFEPDEEGNLAAALAWPRVLDLFAGSGGLGIEALSRGAQSADFVEQSRDAVSVIQSNLRTTDLGDRARVHQASVGAALRRITGPIDLVFLDPPYADADVLRHALETLARSDLLRSTSVVVLEQPATAEPPEAIGSLSLAKTRRHGRTRISLYVTDQGEPDAS